MRAVNAASLVGWAEPPVLAVMPLTVTQHNCLPVGGMTPRRFLDWIIERQVPCRKEGKLRVVEASTFLRFMAPDKQPTVDATDLDLDDEVDRVLAVVGRRLVR